MIYQSNIHAAPLANRKQTPEVPPELGRPAYVVLGMIRLGARSGYEIKQAVDLSIRFFWTISHAQIYPSLEQLERAGFIKGRSEPLGKRRRRTFQITKAGEEALRRWLRQDEPMPYELRDIGLVKVFFADALDRDDAVALVAAVKRRSEARVATLRSIEPAAQLAEQHGNAHPLLTLRMGVASHEAVVQVCREFETSSSTRGRSHRKARHG
jgi:PadR family transcriptional regulator AphA